MDLCICLALRHLRMTFSQILEKIIDESSSLMSRLRFNLTFEYMYKHYEF